MIQRIQSVYLLLAAIFSGAVVFFVPVYKEAERLYMVTNDPIFFSMFILSALISIYSIFRFRNRKQQVVSGRINIIINFVLLGFILYFYFTGFDTEKTSLGFGAFIPIVAIILIALANRAIMRDEALVRAADRLR